MLLILVRGKRTMEMPCQCLRSLTSKCLVVVPCILSSSFTRQNMEAQRDDESQGERKGKQVDGDEEILLIFWGKGGGSSVRAHSVLQLYEYALRVIKKIVGGPVQ